MQFLDLSGNGISDITPIKHLSNLISLILDSNDIIDISPLKSLTRLERIDLSENLIVDLRALENISSLLQLQLALNEINDITPLSSLKDLLQLDLYSNKIKNIEAINGLTSLNELSISENPIENFEPLSSLTSLTELSLYSTQLKNIDFLSDLKHLRELDISTNQISNIDVLENLISLENAEVDNNPIEDITSIRNLPQLKHLNISNTRIKNISALENLKKLIGLYCDELKIDDYSSISTLTQLKSLSLENGGISDLSFISSLKKLTFLNLNNNHVSNLEPLSALVQLYSLYLSNNHISNISQLNNLKKLQYLRIHNNKITDIKSLNSIIHLKKLNLKIHNNPFLFDIDLILDENDNNHFEYILSLLLREKESNKHDISLPVKVLFLGNHASGKSSLLYYLINEDLPKTSDSTHIIRITKYSSDKRTRSLPEAVIFDFGGQDYYHGIYRAFFSKGAIQVLLWNAKSNKNELLLQDSNEVSIRNYNLNYWFGQKKYLEKEKYRGIQSPLLLVQTHADLDRRTSYNNEENCIQYNISNDYFLCLEKQVSLKSTKNKQLEFEFARKYFKSSFDLFIQENRLTKKEPQWYIAFIAYILKIRSGSNSFKSIKVTSLSKYYQWNVNNKIQFLKSELSQLHKKGLVLYYENSELEDIVWLNPESVVEYVHSNVLRKELINNKKKNVELKGKVSKSAFDKYDKDIIKLLVLQKVIFLHQHEPDGVDKYIIPNYLPLAQDDLDFGLLTFGIHTPLFILKFEDYMPFGLINQMTCFYGKLPEKKRFWRNQILFTLNKNLILIQIDFDNLELVVHGNTTVEEQEKKYLFYSIMALYWDTIPLEYQEFRSSKGNFNNEDEEKEDNNLQKKFAWEMYDRIFSKKECYPEDLYISVNNKEFICYTDLCNLDQNSTKILSFIKEANKIDRTRGREISLSQFQFLTNTILMKMKKIFISYSRFDEDYKEEFRKHLVTLKEQKLIEDFNCKQIDLGADWDATIQREVNECEIMICLISVDFLNTDYIRKYEVKKAIEKGKQLIPIIIKPCDWEDSEIGKFYASLRGTNISLDKELFLKNIVKETTAIERAAHWTAIIKEFRQKLFK